MHDTDITTPPEDAELSLCPLCREIETTSVICGECAEALIGAGHGDKIPSEAPTPEMLAELAALEF